MSYFTFSGNKLVVTALAAGAMAVGGTGVAAMADSHGDSPVAPITESPSPAPTDTEAPEPTPTETETESPDPEPTETETAEPEPTETGDPEPEPTETDDPEESPTATPMGPDVTGPAAVGLCNAFEKGGLNSTSTAYTVLMQVAGGDEAIDDYCATIPAPQDRDEDADTDDGTDGGTDGGDGIVEPQNVEPQSEGAPASKGSPGSNGSNGGNGSHGSSGGAGHQDNSAKHSHHGK